jgi:opacity protein-like surface antigen
MADFAHVSPNLNKAGVLVDGGVTLHPNFTVIGEYNYIPIGSGSIGFYGYAAPGSARFHSVQAGGRVNLLSRGRVIPYFVGTAGLIRVGATASLSGPFFSVSGGTSVNRFGFGLGGGFLIRITRHVDIKADYRFLKGYDSYYYIPWIDRAAAGFGVRF